MRRGLRLGISTATPITLSVRGPATAGLRPPSLKRQGAGCCRGWRLGICKATTVTGYKDLNKTNEKLWPLTRTGLNSLDLKQKHRKATPSVNTEIAIL